MSEEVWNSKTDEEVSAASARLSDYTEEGERFIRAELTRRGLPQPAATRQPEPRPADNVSAKAASPDSVLSHWSILIENLQASPLAFYQSVEDAIKRRQLPEITNSRVDYKESGLVSARREYLHIEREKLIVDICGAPFGTGFFVSSWLAQAKPRLGPFFKFLAIVAMAGFVWTILNTLGFFYGLLAVAVGIPAVLWFISSIAADGGINDDFIRVLPLIGPAYEWLFKPSTYYRIDTMLMFQKAVHNAVLEAIDEMTTAKGLRALSESERKPVMREFYERKVVA